MQAFALQSPDKPAGIVELDVPEIPVDGIRVAVRAASVNGFDVYEASGALIQVMEHAFPTTIGRDFSGVVDGVGAATVGFAAGDEVIGFIPSIPPLHSGSFATAVAGGPELVLARKPTELSWETAAALPLAGSAALDLLDVVNGQAGEALLVVGATGGVGSFIVQLAAARGMRVIATAKPDEVAFVTALGAAEVVDYTTGPVADQILDRYPDGVAALIDLVDRGGSLAAVTATVRSGGRVASLLGAVDVDALTARGVFGQNVAATPTPEKLARLAEMAATDAIRVPIHATVPLTEAGDALAAFEAGTVGKLVIKVA